VVLLALENAVPGRWGEWRLPFRGVSGSGLLSREIAYAIYDMYITLKISMRYFSPFLSLDLYLLPETNPAMGWPTVCTKTHRIMGYGHYARSMCFFT
jgi:hypothetical protein